MKASRKIFFKTLKQIKALEKNLENEAISLEISEWNKSFSKLFTDAFHEYLKRKYPDTEKLKNIIKNYDKSVKNDYYDLIEEIDKILFDSRLYTVINQPVMIGSTNLQNESKQSKDKDDDILDFGYNPNGEHSFNIREKIIYFGKDYKDPVKAAEHFIEKFEKPDENKKATSKQQGEKISFFRDNKFFDGFEMDIKKLRYSKEELYMELEKFENIFHRPILPDKL